MKSDLQYKRKQRKINPSTNKVEIGAYVIWKIIGSVENVDLLLPAKNERFLFACLRMLKLLLFIKNKNYYSIFLRINLNIVLSHGRLKMSGARFSKNLAKSYPEIALDDVCVLFSQKRKFFCLAV